MFLRPRIGKDFLVSIGTALSEYILGKNNSLLGIFMTEFSVTLLGRRLTGRAEQIGRLSKQTGKGIILSA